MRAGRRVHEQAVRTTEEHRGSRREELVLHYCTLVHWGMMRARRVVVEAGGHMSRLLGQLRNIVAAGEKNWSSTTVHLSTGGDEGQEGGGRSRRSYEQAIRTTINFHFWRR